MKPHGTYKLAYRTQGRRVPALAEPTPSLDGFVEAFACGELRIQRLIESLRGEILESGGEHLRIRQVVETPREIYRLELELPDLGYQRTTFLDRDTLEELLDADEVRQVVETAALGG